MTHWVQTPYASSSTQVRQTNRRTHTCCCWPIQKCQDSAQKAELLCDTWWLNLLLLVVLLHLLRLSLLLFLLPLLFSCAVVFSADISTVICDKVDKAEVLLENVEKQETPGLRRIVLMDAVQPHLVERGQHCGVHVQAMQDLEVEWWEEPTD